MDSGPQPLFPFGRTALCFSLVAEDDSHIPTLTVRQTLSFAFRCKTPPNEGRWEDTDDHVDMVLRVLGLSHVADTVIGDESLRGISGGERRRATIGEMWDSSIRVLLADRLTDGLDSASASDVIEAIHIWCKVTPQPPRMLSTGYLKEGAGAGIAGGGGGSTL